ncbi:MAG: TetR/AcrR family transcriptional regulator [Gammaproteobacteria bacterium]|jgi:AcrR family transcriptional regulator|nr:TetR/AcrR family transcriptional regulator [Gammaproteobacteria bacterium]MBT5053570.1 TetR/AcrR family transcriptional regulator [Gammaproteobacteria bacterium]
MSLNSAQKVRNSPCKTRDTQGRLLNAAEALFIDAGYAGMSARAIADKAGVNIAAMGYHFGSKQGLLEAVLIRRIAPINTSRRLRLEAVRERRAESIRDILHAFLWPVFFNEHEAPARRLMGRVMTEPAEVVEPLLNLVFCDVIEQFVEAVTACFPKQGRALIAQKFSFVVGALNFTVLRPSERLLGSAPPTEVSFERLLNFSVDGFLEGSSVSVNNKDLP